MIAIDRHRHGAAGTPRPRHRGLVLLAAVALVVVSGCGGARAGDGDEAGAAGPAGSTPAPDGTATAGSGTGGATGATGPGTTAAPSGGSAPGTTAAPSGGPEPWSANPWVEPVGQTIDGTTVTADGRTRTWHLYVPNTLPDDRPVPLLVGLHGGTGWGSQFQRSSGFDGIAEANGFLVVFPDGVGAGPTDAFKTWNAGGPCCGPAAKQEVDDVAFVGQLIDQISADHDVDPDRVYTTGHSNGAVLSIRLACELADQVVAVGFQAGTMEIDGCSPAQPVSMLHLHGVDDAHLPPQGGLGPEGITDIDWNPAIDGLRTLAAAQDCPAPVEVADPDHPSVVVQRWSPCADGTEIEYVLIPEATHAWLGARTRGALEEGRADYDSSAAIWAFLAAHPRR